MVGELVGVPVGGVVGTPVGVTDGDTLGAGVKEGATVGLPLGMTVGVPTGGVVGTPEGTSVGVLLGVTKGGSVGIGVVDTPGVVEGVTSVGVGVGSDPRSPDERPPSQPLTSKPTANRLDNQPVICTIRSPYAKTTTHQQFTTHRSNTRRATAAPLALKQIEHRTTREI
jgi:hypothetical protein